MNDTKQGANQETIKVKAVSEYHDNLSVCFKLHEGLNIVELPGDREDYCLDHDIKSNTCGCGYPIERTKWVCPTGWDVDLGNLVMISDDTPPCEVFACGSDCLVEKEVISHYGGFASGLLRIQLKRVSDTGKSETSRSKQTRVAMLKKNDSFYWNAYSMFLFTQPPRNNKSPVSDLTTIANQHLADLFQQKTGEPITADEIGVWLQRYHPQYRIIVAQNEYPGQPKKLTQHHPVG